jgi:hypothetical protein
MTLYVTWHERRNLLRCNWVFIFKTSATERVHDFLSETGIGQWNDAELYLSMTM